MIPNLSVRNSTLPPFASRTARATSLVTVPDLGFGINPRGPRILPRGPTLAIMSGVAIAESKSVQPSETRLTRSSPPTTSAPASCASRARSPAANTATRTFLPVPFGSTTEPRTICSACRGSTPSRMCASMVASNLEVDVSRTIWQATSGSSPPLPLLATAASTFLAASMYFLPRFLGTKFLQSQQREGEQRRLPGRRPGRLCRRRDERKPAGFLSCFDDLEAHRTGGALDHLHRGFDLIGVEVLALDVHDLPDLLPADPPNL